MSRLSPPRELDRAQRELFDAITTGKRSAAGGSEASAPSGGGLRGPFGPWLHAPNLGMAAQRLGEALRFESDLPARERELAILCVAARSRARFEWWAHARIALDAGLPDDVVESLRTGTRPDLDNPREALVHDVSQALLADYTIPEALYQQAVSTLGESLVVELVVLIGYYVTVAMTLNAFDVTLPDGEPDPFR